jgi:hypothetical protein
MFGISFCEYVAGVLLGHASRFFSVKKPQSYLGDETQIVCSVRLLETAEMKNLQ